MTLAPRTTAPRRPSAVSPPDDVRLPPLSAVLAGLLSIAAGLLCRFAFPDPGWWPLAPVAVAAFTLACWGRSARQGAVLGLLFGLAFFVPLLSWSGVYVGAVPWFALATLQSLYVALLGAAMPTALRWAARRHGGVAALVVACLWVGQEALRDRTPYGGFPWARLAFSQAGSPFGHLAALGGAPLVTFAVALAGAALTVALVRARQGATGRPGATRAGVATVLVVVSGLAVPLPTAGQGVRVAGIQGDVPEAGLDFNVERRAVLDNHARVTRELADRVASGQTPAPDLVVWPENGSDLDPFLQDDARGVIDGAVDAIGAPTLVGAVLRRPTDHLTNASIVWTPGTGPGELYAKRHPVPFAEYIPSRSFYRRLSSKVDLVREDFVAGDRVGTLDLGPAKVGVAICFEVAYDNLVRDTVRAGADLLVVQTNNATFGRTDEAVQQLAMSRLRAIEHGRAVAHVSTVGVSALIAPDGTVLSRSRLFEPAILDAELPLRHEMTWADRLGAWPEGLLVALGLIGLGGVLVRRRTETGLRRPAADGSLADR
ncbi:MAG TPA: apolipoprotein N-acyltransferase [Actinomycetales bacterium]|nr:apolipoprotein N-acyltransferase [Actinomycetales bacterium]